MGDVTDVIVRRADAADRAEVLRMRMTFWPDSEEAEVDDALCWAVTVGCVLVAERPEGGLAGFAELEHRKWAEGCDDSPVAYLEGIWVDGDKRRSGVAAALVRAAEDWARSLGRTELASSCDIDNADSEAFHLSTGFKETGREICFVRPL
jgi:aminoglycoside 6'-N-acetyltransferase I